MSRRALPIQSELCVWSILCLFCC